MEGLPRVSPDRTAYVVAYVVVIELGGDFYGTLGFSELYGVLCLLCDTWSGAHSGTQCDGGHGEQGKT